MDTKVRAIGEPAAGAVVLQRQRLPAWSEIVTPAGWVRAGVVAALVGIAYWVDLNTLRRTWTDNADWTHGWLIPVISAYLVHINRDRLARLQLRPSLLGLVIMIAAALLYTAGVLVTVGYARPLSLVIMIFGVVILLGGWRLARAYWFPVFLLLFAIPLPSVGYFYATLPLRRLVTLLTTGFLNVLPGLQAEPVGTVIEYTLHGVPGNALNVEEACSGMRLMMAFLAMGAVMAYLMRDKPIWHRLTLLVACVPIAIFCNFVRVTTTSLIHIYGDRAWAEGGAHAALGLAMMVVALSLYWLMNWGLSSLVTDDEADPEVEADA